MSGMDKARLFDDDLRDYLAGDCPDWAADCINEALARGAALSAAEEIITAHQNSPTLHRLHIRVRHYSWYDDEGGVRQRERPNGGRSHLNSDRLEGLELRTGRQTDCRDQVLT